MGMQLLKAGAASKTGIWVHSEPAKHDGFRMRVSFIWHGGSAGSVFIEELIGGQPGNGMGSPYPPQSDTGSVVQIAAVPFNSGDLIIQTPVDYIRARTDNAIDGTVDVYASQGS